MGELRCKAVVEVRSRDYENVVAEAVCFEEVDRNDGKDSANEIEFELSPKG